MKNNQTNLDQFADSHGTDTLRWITTIINNGQDIASTNFWESPLASQRVIGISVNAGCLRLLVPESNEKQIPEMLKGCDYAIISTIQQPSSDGLCLEILFEDHSNEPYSISSNAGAIIGLLPAPDKTRIERKLSIWTKGPTAPRKVATLKAFSRSVPRIPWLKPLK